MEFSIAGDAEENFPVARRRGGRETLSRFSTKEKRENMATAFQCRICLKEEASDKNLIVPCQCGGDQRYVHRDCLNRWRSEDRSNLTHCQQCNFDYEITEVPVAASSRWYRRWVYTKFLISELAFYIIGIIITIALCVLIADLILTSGCVSHFFPNGQVEVDDDPKCASACFGLFSLFVVIGVWALCLEPTLLPIITIDKIFLVLAGIGVVYASYVIGTFLIEVHRECRDKAWHGEDAEIYQVRDLKGEH